MVRSEIQPLDARHREMEGRLSAQDTAINEMRQQSANMRYMQKGTEDVVVERDGDGGRVGATAQPTAAGVDSAMFVEAELDEALADAVRCPARAGAVCRASRADGCPALDVAFFLRTPS